MLVVNSTLSVPLAEFEFTFARSGGPGGQNVNKVNSKATLRWGVKASPSLPEGVRQRFLAKNRRRITTEGDLVLSSQRYRDQGRNVADCLDKLRDMLEQAAIEPKPRKKTKPSRAAKRRRLEDKRHRSARKEGRRTPSSGE
jgi:ribosome-associated protein